MNRRVAKWDNLKFFLILCVVTGHFVMRMNDQPNPQRIMLLIYLFHMPAFIFLSGLFSKHTVNEKRYDRAFGYLVAFFLIKVLLFLIKAATSHKLSLNFLEMDDISWYAFVLFFYCLLTMFLSRYHPAQIIGLTVLLACISGYDKSINSFLSAARMINFYPFFLAGYYLDAERLLSLSKKLSLKILSCIVLAGVTAVVFLKIDRLWWLLPLLRGRWPYAELEHLNRVGWLLRLGWYAGAGLLIVSLIVLSPSRSGVVSCMGSRTLAVYVLHYIPLTIFYHTLHGKELASSSGHGTLVLLAAAGISTIVLSLKPFEIVNRILVLPPKKRKSQ